MKKFVFTMIVLAAIAATFGAVGVAYAKGPGQVTETASGWMGGNGSRNGMGVGYAITGEGPLHDYMISEYAKALNISATDLEAQLDNGETMAQIALSEGLTLDQFRTLMVEVRNQAIVLAVGDGVLNQGRVDDSTWCRTNVRWICWKRYVWRTTGWTRTIFKSKLPLLFSINPII
jgi:hypothetical protein